MKTSKLFQELYGFSPSFVGEHVEEIADSLLDRQAAYDESIRIDNETRDAMTSSMPLQELLSEAVRKLAHTDLRTSEAPAVSTLDAYEMTRQAADEDADDVGIAAAAQVFYNRWLDDPYGSISMREVSELHDHLQTQAPHSKVGSFLADTVIANGYAQLPDVDYLTALSKEIASQEDYEAIVENAGFDGDDLGSIRARGFLRAMASLDDSDRGIYEAPYMSPRDLYDTIVDNRAREIAAQLNDPEMEDEMAMPEDTMADDMVDDVGPDEMASDEMDAHEEAEAELPHDQMSEELAEIDSPVSGKPLVVELGVAEGPEEAEPLEEVVSDVPPVGDMGDAPPEALPDFDELDTAGGSLHAKAHRRVRKTKAQAQAPVQDLPEEEVDAADYSDEDLQAIDDAMADEATDPEADPALDPGAEDAPEGAMATTTMIFDPTSGEELLLTLEPLSKEASTSIADAVLSDRWVFGGAEVAEGVRELGIGIVDEDQVLLASYGADGEMASVVRQASLYELDGIVSEFTRRIAAAPNSDDKSNADEGAESTQNVFVLRASVPANAPINARRMMGSVQKMAPSAVGEMLPDGRIQIQISDSELPKNGLARIARVFEDVFAIEDLEIEEFVVRQAVYEPNEGRSPNEQAKGGGTKAAPMKEKQQRAKAGQGVQKAFVDEYTGESQLKVKAQVMPGAEGRGAVNAGDPALMNLSMGSDASGPGEDEPSMADAMEPSGVDFGSSSVLSPEEEQAVQAAMEHFRNMGDSPLNALKQFTAGYSALLEKYGDDSSPTRMQAEAQVIRSMVEAFSKPAVVKVAAIPSPKGKRHPGYSVSISKEMETNPQLAAPKAGKPKKPSGKGPDKSMPTQEESADFGPSTSGRSATPPKSKGTKKPSTKLDGHHDTNGLSKSFDRMTDGLSRAAPSAIKSKKKGADENEDNHNVVVRANLDAGLFELRRQASQKLLARFEDYSEALAAGERRVYGTDGVVLTEDAEGNLIEA